MIETLRDPIEDQYNSLVRQDTYLPPEACREGFAYFGDGKIYDDVAICMGKNDYGETLFADLKTRTGHHFIELDRHRDDDRTFGTFRPYIEVAKVPEGLNEESLMTWLLDTRVEVAMARFDWLDNMPARLKSLKSYGYDLESAHERLEQLLAAQKAGLNSYRQLTTGEVLAQSQTKNKVA